MSFQNKNISQTLVLEPVTPKHTDILATTQLRYHLTSRYRNFAVEYFLISMDVSISLKKYILSSGIGFFLLGAVVILCDAMTNVENEESLKQRQSATAYWVGLPVSITEYDKTY